MGQYSERLAEEKAGLSSTIAAIAGARHDLGDAILMQNEEAISTAEQALAKLEKTKDRHELVIESIESAIVLEEFHEIASRHEALVARRYELDDEEQEARKVFERAKAELENAEEAYTAARNASSSAREAERASEKQIDTFERENSTRLLDARARFSVAKDVPVTPVAGTTELRALRP